ncbi:MAG: outer membrane beta-barrel protein [Flavipsychrobacter sp.]
MLLFIFSVVTAKAYCQIDSSKSIFNDTLQISEIIISAKTAIKVNNDTISYRVDSFYKDPLATAEDVLKRLPGVEVSRDGTITINGKTVTRIYINGKEYDTEDLTSITKNLPAEILEKIQVADYHSEDAIFSGRKEPTEEKVINLQFKKKYKDGIYGRATGGYGTKDRYHIGLFGNYMSKDGLRLTTIIGANNTGISNIESTSNDSWNSPGVKDSRKATINFSKDVTPKWKLSGGYNFNTNKNTLYRSSFRTTYLQNDSLLLQEQSQRSISTNNSHRVNIRSNWDISKRLKIRSYLSMDYQEKDASSNSKDITYQNQQEQIDFQRISLVNSYDTKANIRWNNTIMKAFAKEKRTLIVSVNANYGVSKGIINNENKNEYLISSSNTNVSNTAQTRSNNVATHIGIKYNEPVGSSSMVSLDYCNNYTMASNQREVLVDNNGMTAFDTTQSRNYNNSNNENTLGLSYQYSKNKLYGSLAFQLLPYNRTTKDEHNNQNNISQQGVNYAPRLHLQYKMTKKRNISFGYNGRINAPNLSQLQPIPDYTDSLNIFTGNPNLKPEISNNITLNYRNYNLSGGNTNIYLRSSWYNQKIINNVVITNSKRETTPINADGNYSFTLGINKTTSIIKKKLRFTTSISSSWQNNVNIINNIIQKRKNYTVTPNIYLNYLSDDIYEGNIRYGYNWNKTITTNSTNNLLQTHSLSQQGTFHLPFNIKWEYDLSYIVNNGLNQSFEQEFFLVNTSLYKEFKKINGLFISLQAYDIFNNYPTVQRNINDNYYEDISVNRIGSYYMVSLIYRFTSFPVYSK